MNHTPHGGPDLEWWGCGAWRWLVMCDCAAQSKVLEGCDARDRSGVLGHRQASCRQKVGRVNSASELSPYSSFRLFDSI
jgi:hypothetical protein